MKAAVVLFTRDLRMHDHPALTAAVREAETVMPLFVLDDGILRSEFARPNRVAFLRDALIDLDRSLTERGAGLCVRRGDVVRETLAAAEEVRADAIFLSEDVSRYAQRREHRLRAAAERSRVRVTSLPGVTIVPPSAARTSTGSHFSVFTPYYRRWRELDKRSVERAPRTIAATPAPRSESRLAPLEQLVARPDAPELPAGGERAARERLSTWVRTGLPRYAELHDDLGADATSRLSPYLHFGCVSPLDVLEQVGSTPLAEPFVRQLAWRDFYYQLLAARPETAREDMRRRNDSWRNDADALERWKDGSTGYPIVDAAMRQLRLEGYVHNRARLIAASFLTKHLAVDWRLGARHYFDFLVDGDVASNVGNWQWIAGTGADTRPYRILNPVRQAYRFDPKGDYVRRYVPELAGVEGAAVHEPWKLGLFRPSGYPERMLDHREAAAAFKRRIAGATPRRPADEPATPRRDVT